VPRRVALEIAAVLALYAVAGLVWLHPASVELLRGNGAVMIGEASDSLTNPWQYQAVLDTLHRSPLELLRGALYTDQIGYPEGYAIFIPWSERLIVLGLAPFLGTDLMPTAVVWSYIVASGIAMHACGRLLGWPRLVAFTLGLAFAVCPHTRARAECHIALVGVYFAPLTVIGLRLLAGSPAALGWSRRKDVVAAALCLLLAVSAAHYYAILLVASSPLFAVLYVLFLPRGERTPAALGRLVLAALPALLLLASTQYLAVHPANARKLASVAAPASIADHRNGLSLRVFGAQAIDYVAGDVRFGDRDLVPGRSAITAEVRRQMPVNRHERTNGIRWSVLASTVALAAVLLVRRSREQFSAEQPRLGVFALAFGGIAFLTSFAPQDLRLFGHDVGPVALLARVLPAFRVANRVGVLVHFAALLATGVLFAAASGALGDDPDGAPGRRRKAWAKAAAPALFALVVLEYLPLHPVVMAPVPVVRADMLDPDGRAKGDACGPGVLLPYVTYDWEAEDYYAAMSELRGTSCKIFHGAYLTDEDAALLRALSRKTFTPEDLTASVTFTRCLRARWAMFRLDAPAEFRRAFCAEMGWSLVAADVCRAPGPAEPDPAPKRTRECLP